MPKLRVKSPDGVQYADLGAVTSLGRAPENTVQVLDRTVSRRHCEIINDHGFFILRDVGSARGTLLNGQPVRSSVPLRDGDEISFGDTRALFLDWERLSALPRNENAPRTPSPLPRSAGADSPAPRPSSTAMALPQPAAPSEQPSTPELKTPLPFATVSESRWVLLPFGEGIEQLRIQFRNWKLDFPPLPAGTDRDLRFQHRQLWSTRDFLNRPSPSKISAYYEDGLNPLMMDYAVIGLDATSPTTIGLHYFVLTRTLGVFLQLNYGGAPERLEEKRVQINLCFDLVRELFEATAQAEKTVMRPGDRLLVIGSSFQGSCWQSPEVTTLRKLDSLLAPRWALEEALKWTRSKM